MYHVISLPYFPELDKPRNADPLHLRELSDIFPICLVLRKEENLNLGHQVISVTWNPIGGGRKGKQLNSTPSFGTRKELSLSVTAWGPSGNRGSGRFLV